MTKKNNIAVTAIEYILITGFIIFEELIWNVLAQPVIEWLNHLIIFERLRQSFLCMNHYLLLTVFVLIFALTEYLGVLSGLTVVSGDVAQGVMIYLLKVPLAAFSFWLFELTKLTLLTFSWLNSTYEYLMYWKNIIIGTDIYQSLKSSISVTRNRIKLIEQKYLGEASLFESVKTQYILVKTFFIRPQ